MSIGRLARQGVKQNDKGGKILKSSIIDLKMECGKCDCAESRLKFLVASHLLRSRQTGKFCHFL